MEVCTLVVDHMANFQSWRRREISKRNDCSIQKFFNFSTAVNSGQPATIHSQKIWQINAFFGNLLLFV